MGHNRSGDIAKARMRRRRKEERRLAARDSTKDKAIDGAKKAVSASAETRTPTH